jgi:hypothetical protein
LRKNKAKKDVIGYSLNLSAAPFTMGKNFLLKLKILLTPKQQYGT